MVRIPRVAGRYIYKFNSKLLMNIIVDTYSWNCLKHVSHRRIPSPVCTASLSIILHSGQIRAAFGGSTVFAPYPGIFFGVFATLAAVNEGDTFKGQEALQQQLRETIANSKRPAEELASYYPGRDPHGRWGSPGPRQLRRASPRVTVELRW